MSDKDMEMEVSEDNLSARLSGGAIHVLSDALVSCFKGSGAINHLECNFEDPEDNEQYTLLMQKKPGITQGEKIAGLEQEVAELREALNTLVYKDSWGNYFTGLHGDSDVTEIVKELLNK